MTRKHSPLVIALLTALLLHAAFLTLFLRAPAKPAVKKPIPIAYLGTTPSPPRPAPEKPDLLAEVNRSATGILATDRQSIAPPAPQGQSPPPPVRSVTPTLQPSPKNEPPTLKPPGRATAMLQPKSYQKNREKPLPETKPLRRPGKKTRITPKQPPAKKTVIDLHRPLMLTPSLGSIARWDQERRLKSARRFPREATVDINTRKLRYVSYLARLKQKVEQVWIYPAEAKRRRQSGLLLLAITIGPDGRLLGTYVDRSAGYPLLDQAAIRAVRAAAPFAPLPKAWHLEKLHIKATFDYVRRNMLWGG